VYKRQAQGTTGCFFVRSNAVHLAVSPRVI
jgi:hypothetical protein